MGNVRNDFGESVLNVWAEIKSKNDTPLVKATIINNTGAIVLDYLVFIVVHMYCEERHLSKTYKIKHKGFGELEGVNRVRSLVDGYENSGRAVSIIMGTTNRLDIGRKLVQFAYKNYSRAIAKRTFNLSLELLESIRDMEIKYVIIEKYCIKGGVMGMGVALLATMIFKDGGKEIMLCTYGMLTEFRSLYYDGIGKVPWVMWEHRDIVNRLLSYTACRGLRGYRIEIRRIHRDELKEDVKFVEKQKQSRRRSIVDIIKSKFRGMKNEHSE